LSEKFWADPEDSIFRGTGSKNEQCSRKKLDYEETVLKNKTTKVRRKKRFKKGNSVTRAVTKVPPFL
jgi:hypothetical protein